MQNISFKSRFIPLTKEEFNQKVSKIDKSGYANYPWTIKEGVISNDVYTKYIADCSACLITNGETALLLHLCPTTYSKAKWQSMLTEYFKTNLNFNNKNIHAILVGAQEKGRNGRINKQSLRLNDSLKKILCEYKIPTSDLYIPRSSTDIAYKSSTDEFYITNNRIEKSKKNNLPAKECLDSGFKAVYLSDVDNT